MDNYSVILQNDKVVKASNFGGVDQISFGTNGKVDKFIFDGISYYAIVNYSQRTFIEYVDEKAFNKLLTQEKKNAGLKYNGVPSRQWLGGQVDISFRKHYARLIAGKYSDKIYGLLKDETGLCYNFYIWDYTNPYQGPVNAVKAPNAGEAFQCTSLKEGSFPQKFHTQFKNYNFYNLEKKEYSKDAKLVGEIASLMKTVEEEMILAFNNFVVAGVNTGEFTFTKDEDGHYSKEDFLDYKSGLEHWLNIFKSNQRQIMALNASNNSLNSDNGAKLYIICDLLYHYNMLDFVSVDDKIAILKFLAQSPLTDWYWGTFKTGFQHRETLALRIVQSVKDHQMGPFLKKLTDTTIEWGTKLLNISLYKALFYRMDDLFGENNFTKFAGALNSLVLSSKGIEKSTGELEQTPAEIKQLTKFQFFWGTQRNKNKVKYAVSYVDNKVISFEERVCIKPKVSLAYYSTSVGTSAYIQNPCDGYEIKDSGKLDHFDLVLISFYENPSFIDTTETPGYKGLYKLTYAGFAHFLIEKEDTRAVENLIQVSLLTVGLIGGFGALVNAVRSASFAKGIAGAVILIGETSTYLSQNINFRNYLKKEFPHDYENILSVLGVSGIVGTLAAQNISSKIFNAHTIDDATGFFGTADRVLNNPKMLELLSPNDQVVLREAYLRCLQNFEYYKGTQNIKLAIARAKAVLAYYDDEIFRLALITTRDNTKIFFLENFGALSNKEASLIKKNEDYIEHLDGLTEAEIGIIANSPYTHFKLWYDEKVLDKVRSYVGVWKDVRHGNYTNYKVPELHTLVELEIRYRLVLRPNGEFENGDAIAIAGVFKDQSFDAIGVPIEALTNPKAKWTFDYDEARNEFLDALDKHFAKITDPIIHKKTGKELPRLDWVVLDCKGFDDVMPRLRKDIMSHINSPTFNYKQYRNQLIILN